MSVPELHLHCDGVLLLLVHLHSLRPEECAKLHQQPDYKQDIFFSFLSFLVFLL